jgi:transposase InsO family protein
MPLERSVRMQFVKEMSEPGVNRREVCRRHNVAPKTGYEYLRRYTEGGAAALAPRSKRPHSSPCRLDASTEQRIIELRQELRWGPRKIRWRLEQEGWFHVPAKSTVEMVLKRNGLVTEERSRKSKAHRRFEHERPNDLWQMDFKGHFPLRNGERCHPLLVIDDHSRYLLALRACRNERRETVQPILTELFREHGLPVRMLMDNGPPWGRAGVRVYSELEVWLIRLDVRVSHGRAHHPETQGKVERMNRTLPDELPLDFEDLAAAEGGFGLYRPRYNEERPHEALEMTVPASRYAPSERRYPEQLPSVEYDEADQVRRVQKGGWISYRGREWRVGKAFEGERVAVRPGHDDGRVRVYYCKQWIRELDLREPGGAGECV